MDASEIIISRAGAITVTEIANLGKPSILVPLPNVSHNHQQYNAEVLANIGAAKIIKNEDLNHYILHEQIMEMLAKDTLEKMGSLARSVRVEDVENRIYKEIVEVLKR